MGTLQLFLRIFFCHIISAQSHLRYDDDSVIFRDFGGVLENDMFPFDRDFELLPFNDDVLGSWRNWPPAFHMDPGFPPFMNAPRVQVSCDEHKLTVVVDKKTFGLTLTAADVQLGDNCRSNTELPDQLVFSYQLDECGTKTVLQNGVKGFTNYVNLTPKKPLSPWWQAPLTVHVSCFPRRSYGATSVTLAPSVPVRFHIQVMDSSWTKPAESNSYKRGQVMNFKVSAEMKPNQQLFIHSCFTSASPEPQTKPRHAVIMNKGCSTSLGSPHSVAWFTGSNEANVVNFALNTSHLTSELYIHCSAIISDQGVSSISKSCNYDAAQSKWVELNGDVDVCACCSSKCKSSSVKIHSGNKAIVSTGLLLVDEDATTNAPLDSEPQAASTPGVGPHSPVEADGTVSDSLILQRELPSSQQGVVVVSQDPTSRLTLWLPGQADAEYGKDMTSWSEDGFSVRLSPHGNYLNMKPQTAGPILPSQHEDANPTVTGSQGDKSWDVHTVDVWQIPQTGTTEGLQKGFGRSDSSEVKTDLPNEISINLLLLEHPKPIPKNQEGVAEDPLKNQLPANTDGKDSNKSDLYSEEDEPPGVDIDDVVPEDGQLPIIRSKLEFSKGADGSQKLSYEEDLNQTESKLVQRRAVGEKTRRVPRLKGLRSTFMYLMRKMNGEK